MRITELKIENFGLFKDENLFDFRTNEKKPIILFGGKNGSGKTTLIRQMLGRMDEEFTVGLVSNTHSSFGEILQWVLLAFGLEYRSKDKVELFDTLVDFLIIFVIISWNYQYYS